KLFQKWVVVRIIIFPFPFIFPILDWVAFIEISKDQTHKKTGEMAFPRNFRIHRKNIPKHAAIQKNHRKRQGRELELFGKNALKEYKGSKHINNAAGTNVKGRPANQPSSNTGQQKAKKPYYTEKATAKKKQDR